MGLLLLNLAACQAPHADETADSSVDSDSAPDSRGDSPADTGAPDPDLYSVCSRGGEFLSIQSALDGTEGDVSFLLCNEQYFENVVIEQRSITLVSRAGGDTTFLDGQRLGAVITVVGAPDGSTTLTLEGVSLMNGEPSAVDAPGVGVYADRSWFYDNEGDVIVAGSVTLTESHVHDNLGYAARAPSVSVDAAELRGPGVDAVELVATGSLWVGDGPFTTGTIEGERLTLVGDGAVAVSGTVTNSIVVGATPADAVEYRYTDAYGGAVALGEGSFSADPLFAETSTYTLTPASPCVDAGEGLDDDGSPRDLGWAPL